MTKRQTAPICVLGAGSWGTALAIQLAKAGQTVHLWVYQEQQAFRLQSNRQNATYLPGILFPDTLLISSDLQKSLQGCRDILVVVPSHVFSETLVKIKPFVTDDTRLIWGTKGLDPQTGELLHTVVGRQLGSKIPTAVISGPSFAKEVARGLPTAITIAGSNREFIQEFAHKIHSENFRPYTNDDIVGVQIAGAMKNPIAVAAGICDGLELGANARAALITRGLAEIMRLGIALGGKQETFYGLAGMGDLILTCTDDLSRNRRFGLALGRGSDVEEAQNKVGQLIEGKQNAILIKHLADKHKISVPIVEQVCNIVEGKIDSQQAARGLLQRELKEE